MALNVTTFKTDCDAVSDLIEAESDTSAHYTTMVDAIKADANSLVELKRLTALLVGSVRRQGSVPTIRRLPNLPVQ
jgi:hypothetical protein